MMTTESEQAPLGTWRQWKALEDRDVVVTIHQDPLVEQSGTLLWLADDPAEAYLLNPETRGVVRCWPVVDVRELRTHRRSGLWARKAGLIAKLAVLAAITATVITLVLLTTVAVVQ